MSLLTGLHHWFDFLQGEDGEAARCSHSGVSLVTASSGVRPTLLGATESKGIHFPYHNGNIGEYASGARLSTANSAPFFAHAPFTYLCEFAGYDFWKGGSFGHWLGSARGTPPNDPNRGWQVYIRGGVDSPSQLTATAIASLFGETGFSIGSVSLPNLFLAAKDRYVCVFQHDPVSLQTALWIIDAQGEVLGTASALIEGFAPGTARFAIGTLSWSTSPSHQTTLYGNIYRAAFWGRYLSEAEVLEAARTIRYASIGKMIRLEGVAHKVGGGAADQIIVQSIPEQWGFPRIFRPKPNGEWAVWVTGGQYLVTYLADGCAPVTHGPYIVSL